GNQGADEQVGHRNAVRAENPLLQLSLLVGAGQDIAQNDEGGRGWSNLPQGSGGTNRTAGQRRAVAIAQHGGQGNQPHGYHGGADNAGAGSHQHADQNHR